MDTACEENAIDDVPSTTMADALEAILTSWLPIVAGSPGASVTVDEPAAKIVELEYATAVKVCPLAVMIAVAPGSAALEFGAAGVVAGSAEMMVVPT